MPLNNQRDRRETGIEEPIDIVLRYVSTANNFCPDDKTHCSLSVCGPFKHCPAANLPRQYSSLQLSSVALDLISVFIHAAEEVGAPMHIEHDSFAFFAFPSIEVSSHLNPLRP